MPIETTVHLKTLFPLVLPYAPRVAKIVAAYHLREAAIKFCEETRCWRERINQPLTEAREIVLDVPDYASTHAIEYLRWHRSEVEGDVIELEPIALKDAVTDRRLPDSTAEPMYFTQVRDGVIEVMPRNNATGTLMGSVFLRPQRKVKYGTDPMGQPVAGLSPTDSYYDRVPDYVADRHGDAIAHGALSTMLTLPEVDVRDERDASYYAALFMSDIAAAVSRSFRGEQRTPIRSRASFL